MNGPPLPTFLIIGAQKGGTRWLASHLRNHPDIFMAQGEPSFWQRPVRDEDLESYRSHFADAEGEAMIGESTPGYLMYHHDPAATAARIHAHIPNVKLVAILRNPIDRAESARIHHVQRERLPRDASLLDLVRSHPPGPFEQHRRGLAWGGAEALISGGWYAACLRPYVELFGDRVQVVLNEDISADAEGLYRGVLEHLEVDPDHRPSDLSDVRFSNRGHDEADLDAASRMALWPFFDEDVSQLEQLIGRDLTTWRDSALCAGDDDETA